MNRSKNLAGLVGPTLIAVGVTEGMNMHIFADQSAPIVYLNGTLLFVVGLAMVRAHNVWTWRWPVVLTLIGWIALLIGLLRMVAPAAQQAQANAATYAILCLLVLVGALLSWQAYGPPRKDADDAAP